MPAHAFATHEEPHEQARAARHFTRRLLEPHAKLGRMRRAQAAETGASGVPISELCHELELLAAGDARAAILAAPRHLETGRADAGHIELRRQTRDAEADEQRAAHGHRRRLAQDQAERHGPERGAREGHAGARRVSLHGTQAITRRARPARPIRAALSVALRALLAVLLSAAAAGAEPPKLTEFERRTLDEQAARLGAPADIDSHPEGKRIERVDVVVLDVFDEHDPVPDFANVFHSMTRKSVVERELLFRPGERYVGARVDESARNLRLLTQQLSLVIVVPLRGSAKDRVRVLVIVRDIWSLRLNNDFSFTGHGLQTLHLQPIEQNLAGLHTVLGVDYTLEPDTYSFGALVSQNRILGTSLYALASGASIYNRASGAAEGSRGNFVFGDPLRQTRQRWAYNVSVYWDDEMSRHLLASGHTATYDAPGTPENDAIPIEYRARRYIGGYEAVRSFGLVSKYDLYFGIELDRRENQHTTRANDSPVAEQEFLTTWVPLSDTRVSPFVQLRTHVEHYLHTANLETLALAEDYRLGPEALLRVYPASSKFASTRNLLGVIAGASMTLALGDGLLRGVAQNRVEYEFEGRHDADVLGELRLATPTIGFGRFVFDGLFRDRYENYLNRYFELGGDTRLRGYPHAGYEHSAKGPVAVALNVEFRTRSLDLFSVHSGLAAFFDAGDAAEDFRHLYLRQSAGIGLRFLVPELDRVVLRADWAFPFEPAPGYTTFPGTFYLTYEQAMSMPGLDTPTVTRPDLH